MTSENVFVKKLDIIECLGSCSCICTDKTGTLTQNLMSVANLWVVNDKIENKVFEARIVEEKAAISPQAKRLMEVATLNSRVTLEMKPLKSDPTKEELQPNGDATEIGMYRFFGTCIKAAHDQTVEEYRQMNPKIHEVPFNSKNKWQMSIHAMASDGGKQVMFVKGAPDVAAGQVRSLPGRRRHRQDDGRRLQEGLRRRLQRLWRQWRARSRVRLPKTIAEEQQSDKDFLDKLKAELVGADEATATRNLVFAGLVTLRDPPREEVPDQCYAAGIKVIMVTVCPFVSPQGLD